MASNEVVAACPKVQKRQPSLALQASAAVLVALLSGASLALPNAGTDTAKAKLPALGPSLRLSEVSSTFDATW